MTDKERLETIKELVKKIESVLYDEWRQQELTFLIESLYYAGHVDWLIQQAERVHELESEIENWQKGRFLAVSTFVKEIDLKKRVQELEKQNKRYREALEFYADRENYKPDHYDPDIHEYISMIDHDKGATARKALEGERGGKQ